MELEEKTITGKKYICSNYISLAVWVRLVWDMAALSNTEYYSNITWIAMSLEKSTIMTTHSLKVSNFGTSKVFGTPKNFVPLKKKMKMKWNFAMHSRSAKDTYFCMYLQAWILKKSANILWLLINISVDWTSLLALCVNLSTYF